MVNISPKRILIVYDHRDVPEKMRLTIKHHLQALETSKVNHELVYYNTFDDVPTWVLNGHSGSPPAWLAHQSFDAVILHYSFLTFRTTGSFFYKWKQYFNWISQLDCLKIAIPQDEFDRAGLLDEWLFEWDIPVIFTVQHRQGQGPLYPIMRDKAIFYECLPGYIDEATAACMAKQILPLAERPFDIVYRARHLPYWYGSVAQLKHQIADAVAARAPALGLKCDISTRIEDAVVGNSWLDFIASGKATIGCEGGTSVVDWHGENKAIIQPMLKNEPNLSFEEVKARMPAGWDDYRFLTITPRHFEAVITKTCQILVEGDYRGVLEPNKHYIPLKPDFSNLDKALEKLKDYHFIQEMVDRAYEDVYLSGKYTYQTFAQQIEKAIVEYEQKSPKPIEMHLKPMTEYDRVVETLERQLVAERHKVALLETELLEAKERLGQLNGKLEAMAAERATLLAEHATERTILQNTHATERAVIQNEHNNERAAMQAEQASERAVWQAELEAMRIELEVLQVERANLQAERVALQNEWGNERAAWQADRAAWQTDRANERAAAQADRSAERIIMNAERKKWFILVAITLLGAVMITTIVSTIAVFMVLSGTG